MRVRFSLPAHEVLVQSKALWVGLVSSLVAGLARAFGFSHRPHYKLDTQYRSAFPYPFNPFLCWSIAHNLLPYRRTTAMEVG